MCSTNANLNQRRKLLLENPRQSGQLGFVDQHNAVGWQTYQGLRLTMSRRAASGLSISGNYTVVGTAEGRPRRAASPQIASGYTNPDDPDMDEGHCDQDRKHVANAHDGLPDAAVRRTGAGIVASNWRVSGILGIRSGAWLNITRAWTTH